MKQPNKYTRRPKADTISLKDGITALIDSYRLRAKFDVTSVVANWEQYVGKPIASKTSKIYVHNRKLFVRIESPVLRNELKLMKSKVLEAVNKNYTSPVIDDVIFV